MKKSISLTWMLVLVLALAACGTPAEPTATTQPTTALAEPTAVPYDLTVTVTDQAGSPVSWATGMIQVSGTSLSEEADASGQLSWKGMKAPADSVSISAQGFKPIQQTLSLTQGDNNLAVTLVEDPTQLNPGKTCQPGQKVLYVEDFEDGQAQDLQDISAPKWSFVPVEGRGTVLKVDAPGGDASTTSKDEFSNAVWLFEMSTNGAIDLNFNWHIFEVGEGAYAGLSRYFVVYKPGETFSLNYQRPGEGNNKMAEATSPVFEADSWHSFAIASFNGDLSVWVDGQQTMSATQAVPIDKGLLGIEINAGNQAPIEFDNFVVCELTAVYNGPTAATP